MPEKQNVATQKDQQLSRTRPSGVSPFGMLDRFANEMDRMLSEFGLGRGWGRTATLADTMTWTPQLEVMQRNNELVVRVDLPGIKKDDVKVDVTDEAITIQGERLHQYEEEREGVYRSERSYGSFYRTVPLPEGAITDQAKAAFKDGVLEITMPAPPEQVTRGRRLEISEGSAKTT